MTKETLIEEIEALQSFIQVLDTETDNDEQQVIKQYILTESLPKTKKAIDRLNIRMRSGKRYQLNDIRDLILKGAAGDRAKDLNDLAYRIYKANKRKGGQLASYAGSRANKG